MQYSAFKKARDEASDPDGTTHNTPGLERECLTCASKRGEECIL